MSRNSKRLIISFLCITILFYFIPSLAFAETIVFKWGTKVEAKIIEKTADYIKIKANGTELIYPLEDIESINGKGVGELSKPIVHFPTVDFKKTPEEIFKEVSPAIVVITTASVGNIPAGSGSGFIVENNGVVVTCLHVVNYAEDIKVKTKDGRIFPVVGIIGFDASRDVCLLKIDANGLPVAPLGDANSLEPGAKVFTIGAPLNLSYSISDGLLSAKRKLFSGRLIQFTAPISPGNSGGPVIDVYGKVVGVATFYYVGAQNLNFATPVDKELKDFIQSSLKKATEQRMRILLNNFREAAGYVKKGFRYDEQWAHDQRRHLEEWEQYHPGDWDRFPYWDDNGKLAMEYYKKALDSGIRNPYIYEFLCTLYGMGLGDFDKAIFYIKKAVEIDPTIDTNLVIFFSVYNTKIKRLILEYNYDEAKIWYERYLQDIEELSGFIPDMVSLMKAQGGVLNIDWQKLPKKP